LDAHILFFFFVFTIRFQNTKKSSRLPKKRRTVGTTQKCAILTYEMMRLTLNIVGKTLFGANVEDEADVIGKAMSILMF